MFQSKIQPKKSVLVYESMCLAGVEVSHIPGHINKNAQSNRRTMSHKRSIAISKICHPALKNSFYMGKESLKNCNTFAIFPHKYCLNFNVTMWIYSSPTLISMRESPFLTLIRPHAAYLFIRWVVWGQGGHSTSYSFHKDWTLPVQMSCC